MWFHLLLLSSLRPSWEMPAAGWAAGAVESLSCGETCYLNLMFAAQMVYVNKQDPNAFPLFTAWEMLQDHFACKSSCYQNYFLHFGTPLG